MSTLFSLKTDAELVKYVFYVARFDLNAVATAPIQLALFVELLSSKTINPAASDDSNLAT